MKKFTVEVCWEVGTTVEVYAENENEAIELIQDSMQEIADSMDYSNNYIDGTEDILMEYAEVEDVNNDYEKEVVL